MNREEHQSDNTNKKTFLKNKLKQKLYELSSDKKAKSTTLARLIETLERL
ncbi:hypothetical protein KW855_004313 [Salmonella enterica]|nr:hypothetical protein [Salmonella enterica]EEJ2961756.1 hypothetical protein [Salmonella enterica subsp. enterica serovar Daytona]ELS8778835.1 hypothetical protein [Salmonella enterica subsp. enterica serovar Carrau]EDY4802814.1 hypothetical protein [Salmonella enterica]EDZ1791557.1 hypothetical protein [Salmonella enterica]EEG0776671.1 hypothetical protein [Salmonella enterica]